MPRAPSQEGVIARDAHIQIDLRAQGFGRERLNRPPTEANLAFAARLRKEILGKIERGSFSLAEYFPDSPRVKSDQGSVTWHDLGVEWLRKKAPGIDHSTHHHYKQTLDSYHFADWKELRVLDLDFIKFSDKLAALPAHWKTFNNIASIFGMVLEYGYKTKLIREPLHEQIEFRKPKGPPEPDPFSLEEVDLLLSKISEPRGRNYFEFAFFSGLRPSELISLKWSDVNLQARKVSVRSATTRSKEKPWTKTGKRRTLELTARARAALERQQSISRSVSPYVFLGLDGQPYTTTDGPLDAFWKPALAKTELRARDARQTRHSFASMCLHAGLKPGWVARQLGHSVEMFFRVYSEWIEGQDRGTERSRLDSFIAAGAGTKTGT